MRDLAKNIRLPSIDDLFSTEEERQDAKLEKIQIILHCVIDVQKQLAKFEKERESYL